ncbi:MAG: hypothetical protein SCH70_08060 [Candidatus Methanoperedens sp.]|nr:hypothetical protein [Candidatus Methanoperedens sp.]
MTGNIHVEPHVDAIKMPDNLRIGLMVSEHRKKCRKLACNFDYFGVRAVAIPCPSSHCKNRTINISSTRFLAD